MNNNQVSICNYYFTTIRQVFVTILSMEPPTAIVPCPAVFHYRNNPRNPAAHVCIINPSRQTRVEQTTNSQITAASEAQIKRAER